MKKIGFLGIIFGLIFLNACLKNSVQESFLAKVTLNNNIFCSFKANGEIIINNNGVNYVFASSFSYPGVKINWLDFSASSFKKNAQGIELHKKCLFFSLIREIKVGKDKIEIKDKIFNTSGREIAVIIKHKISSEEGFLKTILSGYEDKTYLQVASNPTIYLENTNSNLGIVAIDSVSRLKFYAQRNDLNLVDAEINNFGLPKDGVYQFEWDIYPLKEKEDYFDFINKVRRDWQVNFRVNGPFDFFDVISNHDLINNQKQLERYFKRKKVGVLALTPWLDYDNYNFLTGCALTRREYKDWMQNAVNKIKKVSPNTKVIGCMPSNFVSLPQEVIDKLWKVLPKEKKVAGMHVSSLKEKEILDQTEFQRKDCLVVQEDGNYIFEVYYPMKDQVKGEPLANAPAMIAVAVYAKEDNSQFLYWLESARFMIEDVGFDGLYIDQFSLAFGKAQRYSYKEWDGVTVSVDSLTGEIIKRYTDAAFVGIKARKKFIEYILSKEKCFVANTYPCAKEVQSFPVNRFAEGYSDVNPLRFRPGQEPPFSARDLRGVLASPIILGYRPWQLGQQGVDNYSELIMRIMLKCLRHGMLFYYFNTDIPEKGKGFGNYEVINHFFPITPVKLGKGFIEGKERIISAVSKVFIWPYNDKPDVLIFNLEGEQPQGVFELEKLSKQWQVSLTLRDWEEVAVIE